MANKPLVVLVDDQTSVHDVFSDIIDDHCLSLEAFETWDKAKEFIEENIHEVDALILDAKGKLRIDEQESECHLSEAIGWVREQKGKRRVIPYAIYTAHANSLPAFLEERKAGRMFSKPDNAAEVLKFLKGEIANTEKYQIINKYPEPFACFGGNYLDKKYETYLLDVIKTLRSVNLSNPQDLLFNPCRTILEQVFRKINEVDEKVLPYAILDFENQKVGLANCSKYLSGLSVNIKRQEYRGQNFLDAYISEQIQSIIYICHPASHKIQEKYTRYTFNSVLWAIFDVLIWLKSFIDKNQH
jgi:hypothetical protein